MWMQLIRRATPTVALALVLAGSTSARAEETHADDLSARESSPPPVREVNVRVSSEVSSYADTDHVYVVSPTIGATIASPTAGWSVNARYLVDVVSAASVDIVSTASRRWEEVRNVGSAEMEYKPDSFGFRASANVSSEPDYLSLTGGAALVKDLLDKHVTLLGGYSFGHDIGGRTGTPWSVFSRTLDRHAFKLGATFVVNRTTIASAVLDTILERGDPSKPYRYVPIFAPGTDVPKGAPPELVASLRTSARPLEQLPLSRDRFALSGRIAHRIEPLTLRADERVYADSWAMFASTTDARLLIDVSRRIEVGPHVRFHVQKAVNFWQRAYVLQPGLDFPALRTGDRELGPLWSATGGGSLRWKVGASEHPESFVLGFDANITTTQYLDDIYLTHRLSGIGAFVLEMEL
jgi:Protein of unknown function (DUF3570)